VGGVNIDRGRTPGKLTATGKRLNLPT
jgi:hypothetical protein